MWRMQFSNFTNRIHLRNVLLKRPGSKAFHPLSVAEFLLPHFKERPEILVYSFKRYILAEVFVNVS